MTAASRQRHGCETAKREVRTDGDAGGAAEDDDVEQRVGAETVGAVDAGRCRLAGGQQTGHDLVGVLLRRVHHLQGDWIRVSLRTAVRFHFDALPA